MTRGPKLRILRNPALDHLLDQCVLKAGVQVDVQFVNEVDGVGEVLSTHEQVEQNVEHLLLATAQQVVVHLEIPFSKTNVGGVALQCGVHLRQSQIGRRPVGEDSRQRVVDRVDESRLEGVRVEFRPPDFFQHAPGHLRDIRLEPRVVVDVSSRTVPVVGDIHWSPSAVAKLRNRAERTPAVEGRYCVPIPGRRDCLGGIRAGDFKPTSKGAGNGRVHGSFDKPSNDRYSNAEQRLPVLTDQPRRQVDGQEQTA